MGDVELLSALTKARVAVDQSMAFWVMVNGRWDEESATVILCQNAAPYVKPITFNRTHEGIVGADWLWWWVDPSGVCFGMLVQAKNLNREKNTWSIGFGHANRSGSQLPDLLRTADHFEVPPVYVLYCGDTSYRAGLTCGDDHTEPTCTRCARAGVSVLSALVAHELLSTGPGSVAVDAFHLASPLEDLADPELPRTRFWDLNFPNCSPELRRLLVAPEYGAPQVASIIWKQMSRLRTRSYSLAVSEEIDMGHSKIFENLPADRGHFPVSYFPHVLRGLRSELPSYVREAEAARSLPSSLTDRIAGIVIFYLY